MRFQIPYNYTYNGTYEIEASSKEEALDKIRQHCGADSISITSTLPDNEVCRDFDMHTSDEGIDESATPLGSHYATYRRDNGLWILFYNTKGSLYHAIETTETKVLPMTWINHDVAQRHGTAELEIREQEEIPTPQWIVDQIDANPF